MANQPLRKNVILEGVFSAETPDTSGEVLDIRGADISALVSNGYVNTEHISPTDAEKSDSAPSEQAASTQGFQTIVGRILRAKKIFSEKDAETPKELNAWKTFKVPLIYGALELWDGPEAHANAQAAASIAKMLAKNPDGPKLGVSVEGATLKRDGKRLAATVIRDLALTLKPCLRSARINVSDAYSLHKNEYTSAYKGEGDPLFMQTQAINSFSLEEEIPSKYNDKLLKAVIHLKKTLTAESAISTPSSLTNGAAVAKTNSVDITTKLAGQSRPTMEMVKSVIPAIDDERAHKITDLLKEYKIQKMSKLTSAFYDTLKTGK